MREKRLIVTRWAGRRNRTDERLADDKRSDQQVGGGNCRQRKNGPVTSRVTKRKKEKIRGKNRVGDAKLIETIPRRRWALATYKGIVERRTLLMTRRVRITNSLPPSLSPFSRMSSLRRSPVTPHTHTIDACLERNNIYIFSESDIAISRKPWPAGDFATFVLSLENTCTCYILHGSVECIGRDLYDRTDWTTS